MRSARDRLLVCWIRKRPHHVQVGEEVSVVLCRHRLNCRPSSHDKVRDLLLKFGEPRVIGLRPDNRHVCSRVAYRQGSH